MYANYNTYCFIASITLIHNLSHHSGQSVGLAKSTLGKSGVETNDIAHAVECGCLDGKLLVRNQPSDTLAAGRCGQRTLVSK